MSTLRPMTVATLICPRCQSVSLAEDGPPSFADGRRGFRCNRCGAELAPSRGWLGRVALLGLPLFAILFGGSLVAAAVLLFLNELPCAQPLGFAGLLGVGGGIVALERIIPELRKPRPKRLADVGCVHVAPAVPSPRRPPSPSPPGRSSEPEPASGEPIRHFHAGPEGIATGWGGFFPVYFILVMVASLIVFKNLGEDHLLYRSPWPELITAAVTGLGTWLIGRFLNRGLPHRFVELPRSYRDPRTGELSAGTPGHTFLFVRLEYCGVFALLFYVSLLLVR